MTDRARHPARTTDCSEHPESTGSTPTAAGDHGTREDRYCTCDGSRVSERPGSDNDHPSDVSPRDGGSPDGVTRRDVLLAGGVVAAGAVAGCLGGAGGPAAVAIPADATCDACGMVISEHPGPNGQIFFRDGSPAGHGDPAWFDSLKMCSFKYRFERERRGWTIASMYATDYSAVDYEVTTAEGTPFIPSYTAPESFAPAAELHYVVGSDVQGAMGPDFVPFSVASEAEEFADEWGGQPVVFDEIDETLLGK